MGMHVVTTNIIESMRMLVKLNCVRKSELVDLTESRIRKAEQKWIKIRHRGTQNILTSIRPATPVLFS